MDDVTMEKSKHTLSIRLSQCDGAAIRALDLMERRGFNLLTCSLEEGDHNGRAMKVTVASLKAGDLLKRQLERLCDVIFVEQLTADSMKQPVTHVQDMTRRI